MSKEHSVKRQMDELGRIVIPKDIRKQANIMPKDYFNIYCEDKIIKMEREECKDQLDYICNKIARSFYDRFNNEIIIVDKEKVISTFGKVAKQYLSKTISSEVLKMVNDEHLGTARRNGIQITKDDYIKSTFYYFPIKDNFYNI